MCFRHVLAIFTLVSIFAGNSRSADLILLDNTNGLEASNLSQSYGIDFQLNATAYQRINGYTFDVGSTSYEVTSVSISLKWLLSGTINPTMRLQFWELQNLTAKTPDNGAVPFYVLDATDFSIDNSNQYFTFVPASGAVNLKANTRYSIGLLSDQTTSVYALSWQGFNPIGSKPSGSFGLSSLSSGSAFYSYDGGSSFGEVTMQYSFQMTGTPVPEASTFALAGICVLTLSLSGLRFRQRKSQ